MNYKFVQNIKSNLFYIAWIIMVIHICIANSDLQNYSISVVSYIAMSIFVLKIVLQKRYEIKEIVGIVLILFLGLCAYRASDDMRVLWFAVVMCASKDIDFEKIVRYNFNTMSICCILFFILYIVGITEETMVESVRGIRHGFGLGHPNMCSAYYMLLMIQYIYINFKKIKSRDIGSFAIGSCIMFYITKSITGFITSFVVLVIILSLKYMPHKEKISKIIIIGLLCGVAAFTIIQLVYNEHFSMLDSLMTGRLHQANYYYVKYGIHLFGNNVNEDLTSIYTNNILDIGYAKMLFNNGLIYYLVVVIGYVIVMFKTYNTKRYDLLALVACFIIYMFTENVATYVFMNVTMLLFPKVFVDTKKKMSLILKAKEEK